MADNKTQIVITAKDETQAAIRSAQTGMQQLSDAASKIGFGGFAGGIAALAGGAALTNLVTGTIQWAAAMDDLSEKTGASVENLSGLAKVASISGQSIETVEQGLIRLSKALAGADDDAKGAGRALEALKLDPEKLRAMDSAEALKAVADAMGQFRDGTGKTALALDLFGKSGAQLLPFLKDLAEQQTLAGKLTTEQAAAAEALEKAWRRTTSEGSAVAKGLVMDLIPAFAYAVDIVKGAKIGIAQFGSSLAVVAKDVETAVRIIAAAGANVTNPKAGAAAIKEILDERARFVEAANEDLEQRTANYKSTYDEITKVLAGGGTKLPTLDYTSKGAKEPKAPKVKAEKELSAEDMAYGGYKGAYKEFTDAIKRVAENAENAAAAELQIEEEKQRRLRDLLGNTTSFRIAEYDKQKQALRDALQIGEIDTSQFEEAMAKIDESIGKLTEDGKDKFKELERAIDGWGKSSAKALADFVTDGKASFSDLARSIINDLLQMAIYQNITGPLFKGISSNMEGAGGIGGFLSGIFGGGRASGGPVIPGQYYVVGENGPEVLVPGMSGTVIPNGAGGGAGLVVNIIEAPGKGGETQQRQENGQNVLDVFVEKVKGAIAGDIVRGDGAVPAALNSTYGLGRVAGAY